MIRELKSRLKEKFNADVASTSPERPQMDRPQLSTEGHATVVPKLSKVFEARRIQVP
jgi:hypothetical protein